MVKTTVVGLEGREKPIYFMELEGLFGKRITLLVDPCDNEVRQIRELTPNPPQVGAKIFYEARTLFRPRNQWSRVWPTGKVTAVTEQEASDLDPEFFAKLVVTALST